MAGPHQLAAVARLGRKPLRMRCPLPLHDEPLALFLKRCRERSHHFLQRGVMPITNSDRQREFAHRLTAWGLCARSFTQLHARFIRSFRVAFQIDLAHHRNVAVHRRTELPIHLEVLLQVLPAVARAHKPAAHAHEPATCRHRQRPLVLPCQQNLVSSEVERPRRVTSAAAIQMRRQQRVHLQSRNQIRASLQAHVLQHHPVVRIADDLLGHAVAPVGVAVHVAHPQGRRVDVLETRLQVTLFLVHKRLAVGDQELHIPRLRMIDGGTVDLVKNSVRARDPDAARCRVGRHHRVLQARRPPRFDARRAKRLALLLKPPIQRLIAHAHSLWIDF